MTRQDVISGGSEVAAEATWARRFASAAIPSRRNSTFPRCSPFGGLRLVRLPPSRFGQILVLGLLLTLVAPSTQAQTFAPILTSGTPNPDGELFAVGASRGYPFWQFDVWDDRIAFAQYEPAARGLGRVAIYLAEGGTYTRLVDLDTAVPNGTGTFSNIDVPLLLHDGVAFKGEDAARKQGLYLARPAGVEVLADFPGFGEYFVDELDPSMESYEDRLVFRDNNVLYLHEGGVLSRLLGAGDPLPGGVGEFVDIIAVDVSRDLVAFTAGTSVGWGVFTWSAGTVVTLADQTNRLTFGPARPVDVSVDGSRVAFTLSGPDSIGGVYLWSESSLARVVSETDIDPLSGKPLRFTAHVQLSPEALWFWAMPTFTCTPLPLTVCSGPAVIRYGTYGTLYSLQGRRLVPILSRDDTLDGWQVDKFVARLTAGGGVVLASSDTRSSSGQEGGGLYFVGNSSIPTGVPTQGAVAARIFGLMIALLGLRAIRSL